MRITKGSLQEIRNIIGQFGFDEPRFCPFNSELMDEESEQYLHLIVKKREKTPKLYIRSLEVRLQELLRTCIRITDQIEQGSEKLEEFISEKAVSLEDLNAVSAFLEPREFLVYTSEMFLQQLDRNSAFFGPPPAPPPKKPRLEPQELEEITSLIGSIEQRESQWSQTALELFYAWWQLKHPRMEPFRFSNTSVPLPSEEAKPYQLLLS